LRNSFYISSRDLDKELTVLKENLKQHETNKTELRAYLYLDIISWLESKMQKKGFAQDVIRQKYLERQKTHQSKRQA
jgi:hypothetical protein